MKRRILLSFLAATVVAGTVWTHAVGASNGRRDPQSVTFTEINHPGTDVDLDLGASGLSLGDEQIFHATLQQAGKDVGHVYGVGTVVQASDSGLSSQVVSTAVFPDGTFTLQLMFQMRFQDGPPPTRRGAITGGTGAYRAATGECVSTVIPDSDNNTITCRFAEVAPAPNHSGS